MARLLSVVLLSLAAQAALAQDPAAEKAATAPTAAAAQNAAEKGAEKNAAEFKLPPGFFTKKRGALTVYCKKDREIGTRFVTEKCFDNGQMRAYLLALEIQKSDLDRIRSTCGSAAACGSQ